MIYHELYCCYNDGGGSQIAGIAANPNSEILSVFFLLNDTVLEMLRIFEFFVVLRHVLLFESLVTQAMLLMDFRSDHIHACRDCMNADCCISLQANVWLRPSTY